MQTQVDMEVLTVAEHLGGDSMLRLADDGAPANPLTVVDLGAPWPGEIVVTPGRRGVVVGLLDDAAGATDAAAPLPPALARSLTTTASAADLEAICATVAGAPLAATTLAGLLDVTAALGVEDGLVAESLAYSMLLAGPEFATWRAANPRSEVPAADEPVVVARDGDVLRVVLNRPERHNAFGHAVRDGLIEALQTAELDDSITRVDLVGAGRSFCSGGDLDEFGTAIDVARAHATRLTRSAGLLVHRLRDRVRPVLHGSCIGAGVEVPAFADTVVASDDASFWLPELSMGLLPGAGGTVSIPRRIGRHRAAWLALTGHRIDVETAVAWGLVDGRA